MSDVPWIIGAGTALLLGLGTFITLMTLTYQQKRLQYRKELDYLAAAYQREILKARLETQEQTLLAVSQELHDHLGQHLALVRLHVSTMDAAGGESSGQKIRDCKEILDKAITALRAISRQLNSHYVDRQPLPDLLRDLLQAINETGVLAASFHVQGAERDLPAEKKLLIFRMAQEALSNSIRHAQASNIQAVLAYLHDKMVLRITDDGKGIPASTLSSPGGRHKGSGLHNLQYRAGLIGAQLQIRRQEPRGTLVSIVLPYHVHIPTSYEHNQSSPGG
jgi:two-component system, NarL family, sensor kinase